MIRSIMPFVLMLTLAAAVGMGQESSKTIPAGAKVFISPMSGGLEKELAVALRAKKVPVEVVTEKEKAEFEINGASESKKAGAAKIIIRGSFHSSEQASVTVTNLKSGETVWAYSVNKSDSAHGKRSSAEACAKHLKEKIESKK
jgi:nucleoid-associated protein YgaU